MRVRGKYLNWRKKLHDNRGHTSDKFEIERAKKNGEK